MRAPALAVALALAVVSGPAALAGDLTLTTADGVSVHATDYGKGTRGVVLVHGQRRSRQDWSWFAERLATQDFHVVAIDLRGHGDSVPPEKLTADDYGAMTADVGAAVSWLRSRGATRISLVGAELGATLVTHAAAADPGIGSLILLSPGLNLEGLTVSAQMEAYGERPVLLIAADEDTYAKKSAWFLETKAKGEKHVEVVAGNASGTRMLTRSADLEGIMLSWLNDTYALASGTDDASRDLSTGPGTEIETSGVKFGDEADEGDDGDDED